MNLPLFTFDLDGSIHPHNPPARALGRPPTRPHPYGVLWPEPAATELTFDEWATIPVPYAAESTPFADGIITISYDGTAQILNVDGTPAVTVDISALLNPPQLLTPTPVPAVPRPSTHRR